MLTKLTKPRRTLFWKIYVNWYVKTFILYKREFLWLKLCWALNLFQLQTHLSIPGLEVLTGARSLQTISLQPALLLLGPVTRRPQRSLPGGRRRIKTLFVPVSLPSTGSSPCRSNWFHVLSTLPEECISLNGTSTSWTTPSSQRSGFQFHRVLLYASWLWKHQRLPWVPPALL